MLWSTDKFRLVTTFAVVWIEIICPHCLKSILPVTTFAVVWIEIRCVWCSGTVRWVTTFAVVWIEIQGHNPIHHAN